MATCSGVYLWLPAHASYLVSLTGSFTIQKPEMNIHGAGVTVKSCLWQGAFFHDVHLVQCMEPSTGSWDRMNEEFQSTPSPFLALSLQKLSHHLNEPLLLLQLHVCEGLLASRCRPASESGEGLVQVVPAPQRLPSLCWGSMKPLSIKIKLTSWLVLFL